jgi:hypothetical protein
MPARLSTAEIVNITVMADPASPERGSVIIRESTKREFLRQTGPASSRVLHELYPLKDALDRAIAGMEGGMPEQFGQLEELLVTLDANVGRS